MTSALLTPPAVQPPPVLLVTRREAELARVRLSGGFTRIRPGVYAVTKDWNGLKPWQRYLARVHAYALVNPDAVFALESAAALRGWPVFDEPRDIHVYSPHRTRSRRFGDVYVHTSMDERTVESASGLLLLSEIETAVDLMRVLPPAFALSVGDAVLHRGGDQTLQALQDFAAAQAAARGERQLRWLWARIDARAESPLESSSRAVIEWCGFAEPELQHEFSHEGCLDRSDFYWPGPRAVGEADGYSKYVAETTEETTARVIAEKKREDRLRRHEGSFARWDYSAVMNVTPLRDALLLANVPLVRPPQRLLLRTLARNPRALPRTGAAS